jgi:hypothetical protein
MGRIHGRNGRIYMGIASDTASAEPLPFFANWSITFATEKANVTAMGDQNMVYVAGLPDAQGELAGFYDDATNQTYLAAVDGLPRKFYIYPSTNLSTQYWFGTILPDFSVNAAVDGPVEVKASWNAASRIAKVG